MNLTILTHTHTDCEDLWEPYFDSYDKFFNLKEHLVLTNKTSHKIKKKQLIYNEDDKYSTRLLKVLTQITTNYVIISFEDMILIDNVLINELNKIIHVMDSNNEIMFTRLIKTGVNSNDKFIDNLYKLNSKDFSFSITPTIWRVDTLIFVLNNLKNLNVWDLETTGDLFIKKYNIMGLYYYNNESIRGLNHYDSNIYPHICSAIFKGRWNMSEYRNELSSIIKKYNIDISKRGVYE